MLRQRCAGLYLFSNTLAPSIAGASIKCVELLRSFHRVARQLEENNEILPRGDDCGAALGSCPDGPPIAPDHASAMPPLFSASASPRHARSAASTMSSGFFLSGGAAGQGRASARGDQRRGTPAPIWEVCGRVNSAR
jgi:hypothetical protein